MNDRKKFNEKSLPEKYDFYNQLNMEDITDADHAHAKRVSKDFDKKNKLREYRDLYAQSDMLLLDDVFENFRNMCINIYELHPQNFFQLQD